MVSASYSNWRADLEQLDEGAAQAIRLGLAAGTAIGGAILGKKAHDAIKGMTDRRNKKMDDAIKKQEEYSIHMKEGEVVTERMLGAQVPWIELSVLTVSAELLRKLKN